MIRAVLDTNVVVSALLSKGPTSQLVEAWQHRRFLLLLSKGILEEYLRVLTYPKFRLSEKEAQRLIEWQILPYANPVTVVEIPPVVQRDPSDDIFLACAVVGHADLLVSGDRHLLDLRSYKQVRIVSVERFLALLRRA